MNPLCLAGYLNWPLKAEMKPSQGRIFFACKNGSRSARHALLTSTLQNCSVVGPKLSSLKNTCMMPSSSQKITLKKDQEGCC